MVYPVRLAPTINMLEEGEAALLVGEDAPYLLKADHVMQGSAVLVHL